MTTAADRFARLARFSADVAAGADVAHPDAPTRAPATAAQRRLWFLDQLRPGNVAYNIPDAVRITGPLDVDALGRALALLAARQPSLRTRFEAVDGEPWQVIDASAAPALVVDRTLAGRPDDAARADALAALAREEFRRPFALDAAPLCRTRLVVLGDEEHVLLVTCHHTISDGWSGEVLFADLADCYAAARRGTAPARPAPATSCLALAARQRDALDDAQLAALLDHWRGRLADLPTLALPTDRVRPASQSFAGARHRFALDAGTARALASLAREAGATPFMALLAAFQVLLHRVTGEEDVPVGCPIANRTDADTEGLVGYLANTLVLRGDLAGDPDFRTLLARSRATALAAYAHQALPFERLVEALRPGRDLGRNPLFQVAFVLQNYPRTALELDGVRLEPLPADAGTAKFDLLLELVPDDGGYACALEYATDLFTAATAERLAGQFVALLQAIGAAPDAPVSTLSLARPGDAARLAAWNDTARAYPAGLRLGDFLRVQATRTPHAPALVDGAHRLDYAALDACVAALARRLHDAGVGPGARVVVCAERSAALVVALHAVVRAGAAYVPLDPSLPAARLAHMRDDAAPALVLADAAGARALHGEAREGAARDHDTCAAWRIDDVAQVPAVAPVAPPAPALAPDDPAYVIYTSGSTGTPKGAINTHAGICNRLLWMQEAFALGADDRVLLKTPVIFDVSVWELFWPFVAGATLVVAPPEAHRDPAHLAALVVRERVTTVHFVPSMLELFLAEPAAAACAPVLRRVIASGEALTPPLQGRFFAVLGTHGAELHNLYGPTEAAVDVSWWRCVAGDPSPSVPIGAPIANTRLHVVDAALRELPPGVPGELVIGGVQVGLGYLNRPALTAERFVADPFAAAPGARLYRTGDRARRRDDGMLEYLGRLDFQVKLRGQRIELGEIEATLQRHPAVREAVVQLRDDAATGPRLVAWVVPAAGAGDDETAVAQVAQWRDVFEEAYAAPAPAADPREAFAGWTSAVTGAPIPREEMRAWAEATCDAIRRTGARRILELGCGTGLLLSRLAGTCTRYVGCDPSRTAIAALRGWVATAGLPQVELHERAAHDLDDFAAGDFDAVVLNSVVQYFPGEGYLRDVLARAAALLAPGGVLFVGDVRNADALRAATAERVLHGAAPSESAGAARARLEAALRTEQELLVAPAFFATLRAAIPALADVRIEAKHGAYDNELARWRYDVTLATAGAEPPAAVAPVALDVAPGDLAALARALDAAAADVVRVTGLADARAAAATARAAALDAADASTPLAALVVPDDPAAVHPDAVRALAAAHGWTARVAPALDGAPGRLDATFVRAAVPVVPAWPDVAVRAARPLATDPLRRARDAQLAATLRAHAQRTLPEVMVPARVVVLDRLPLGPTGKVDRRALPAPDDAAAPRGATVPPATEAERLVAECWAQVLGDDALGRDDDFFARGGHSLLATRVVARLRERTGAALTVRTLFERPVLRDFAAALELLAWVHAGAAPAPDYEEGTL